MPKTEHELDEYVTQPKLIADGYATLGSCGKVPATQLLVSASPFMSMWRRGNHKPVNELEWLRQQHERAAVMHEGQRKKRRDLAAQQHHQRK
jgi:hypothetical protein